MIFENKLMNYKQPIMMNPFIMLFHSNASSDGIKAVMKHNTRLKLLKNPSKISKF